MRMILAALVAVVFAAGCVERQTNFLAAGVHKGKNYKIEVIQGEGVLLLNDERAFVAPKGNLNKNPNCNKTSFYNWKCDYTTDYRGMVLRFVAHQIATPGVTPYSNYDIYLDGDFVQRVVAPLF